MGCAREQPPAFAHRAGEESQIGKECKFLPSVRVWGSRGGGGR